jgi:hypothetical protein
MHIRLTVLASPLKPEVIGTFTNSVLDIAHIDFPYSPSVCPPYDDRRSLNGELPSMWGAECGWTLERFEISLERILTFTARDA